MSWLYSLALVEAFSAANCSDGEPCALWSGTHTQHPSWLPAKTTKRLSLSRSGMTYRPLTDDLGADVLTSFLADFPVRTFQQPERVQESTANDLVCGHTWRALSVRFCPDSCSWKTAQCLWDEDLHESSVILPRWGMTANGECWERMTWVRPMSVSACGSWPTPTAHKTTQSGQIVNSDGSPWDGKSKPHSKTTGRPITTALADAVQFRQTHWPTPTVCGNYNRKGLSKTSGDGLATAVKKKTWPTPLARDWKGSIGRSLKGLEMDLPTAVKRGGDQTQPTTLNPAWVEWLMGWPIGWTDLKPLETDKFQQWLDSHGKR